MKKILIFILFLLAYNTFFAQKGLSLGITGGANSIWIINQNNFGTLNSFSQLEVRQSELSYKLKFSYQTGIQATYNISQKCGVMVELNYTKAGQKYEDNMFEVGGRLNVKRNITLSYLQIPISFKYTSLKGKVLKFFVYAGPQLGVAVSKKDEVKIENVIKYDTSFAISDKFKSYDFGFTVGAGVNIYLNKNIYIPICASTYYGFTDINGPKTKEIDWYSKNDIKYQKSHNFRIGLSVGVCYNFTGSKYYKIKH